jgi:hypothetical protein
MTNGTMKDLVLIKPAPHIQSDKKAVALIEQLANEFQKLAQSKLMALRQEELEDLLRSTNADLASHAFVDECKGLLLGEIPNPDHAMTTRFEEILDQMRRQLHGTITSLSIETRLAQEVLPPSATISQLLVGGETQAYRQAGSSPSSSNSIEADGTRQAKRSPVSAPPTTPQAVFQEGQRQKRSRKQKRKRHQRTALTDVNVLTNKHIPSYVISTLSKGLNYIPESKVAPQVVLREFDSALVSMRQIAAKNLLSNKLFGPFCALRTFRDAMADEINRGRAHHNSNVKNTTTFLKEHKLIALPADKNLGMTIMDADWYTIMVEKHLSDTSLYRPEAHGPHVQACLNHLESILRKQRCYVELKSLIPKQDSWIAPEFYMLPKLHKTPPGMRPIVPSHSWITTPASKWLDKILQPILSKFHWVVKGTYEVVDRLESFQIMDPDCIIVTADVESMYTNIDIDEGVGIIETILREHGLVDSRFIALILKWVLQNNYFTFRGNWYKQIKGTAMGTNVAPVYANLVLVFYERLWQKHSCWPKCYYRFIDDIFFVVRSNLGHHGLIAISESMNRTSSSFKFTFQQSMTGAPFLDLYIMKDKSFTERWKLSYRLYDKPTNKHLYTSPDSYHPFHQMFSWLTGENIRILRNSSSYESFNTAIEEFKDSLRRRQYPEGMIERFVCYGYSDRARFLFEPIKYRKLHRPVIGVHNIQGREELVKYLRHAVGYLKLLFGSRIPDILIVTYKGRTLLDEARATNKEILHE